MTINKSQAETLGVMLSNGEVVTVCQSTDQKSIVISGAEGQMAVILDNGQLVEFVPHYSEFHFDSLPSYIRDSITEFCEENHRDLPVSFRTALEYWLEWEGVSGFAGDMIEIFKSQS